MSRARHSEPVTVRFTPDGRRLLDAAARIMGLSVSDIVRDAALSRARQMVAAVAASSPTGEREP